MSEDHNYKKENGFSSRLGFLFAATAGAVGIGNIWRFSAEAASNGGGIFVFCYVVCIMLIGYPLSLGELSLGRAGQKGAYGAYKKQGNWRYLGFFSIITCFLLFCFYNVVAGWVVAYVGKTITGELFSYSERKEFLKLFNDIRASALGNIVATFIMALGAFAINYAGVSGGIEKCSKILMPMLIFMMLALIVYSLSLDNAMEGVRFYLYPKWGAFSFEAVTKSLSQSFLSLSIGVGALISYGSYVDKKDNMVASSLIIVIGDTLVAIAAGFFLFAFLGFQRVDLEHIEGGTGVAFISLPMIFKNIGGVIGSIVSLAFFLLLIFAAITSSIALLEAPTQYMQSYYQISRTKSLTILSIIAYAISILCIIGDAGWLAVTLRSGEIYTFHDGLQDFILTFCTPIAAFLTSLFIGYQWEVSSLFKEVGIEKDKNSLFATYITITIKYVAPLLVGLSCCYSLYFFFKNLFC